MGLTHTLKSGIIFAAGAALFPLVSLAASPQVTLTLSPSTIPNGGTFTASWVGEGLSACSGYGPGFSEQETLPTTGSKTTTYQFYPGSYPTRISCTLPGTGTFGASDQKTLIVTGPVISSFVLSPNPVTVGTAAAVNSNFTLSWSTTGATGCTAIAPVDLSGVDASYEQAGSFPGQATFWSGEVGTSGSRPLALPKTAWPNTYKFGLTCRDGAGVTTTSYETIDTNWLEGKPKTVTITAPASNTQWTPGQSQTVNWKSTWLSSNFLGEVTLETTGVVGPPKVYYLAQNIPNSGSYTWDGKTHYIRTNTYACSQNGAASDCFTPTTAAIPGGTYALRIAIYANPGDVFDTNRLGQFIVNGLPSNIISKVPFFSDASIGNTQGVKTYIGLGSPATPPPSPAQQPPVGPAGTSAAPATQTPTAPTAPKSVTTPSPSPVAQSLAQSQLDALRAKMAALKSTAAAQSLATTQNAPDVVSTPKKNAVAETCIKLTKNLGYRTNDAKTEGQVSILQSYLVSGSYLTTSTYGYFGPATLKAVKAFQKGNGISATGYVGPLSRAKIQSLSCH